MQEDGIRDVSLRRVGSTQQWDYCTCGGSSGTIAPVEAREAVGLTSPPQGPSFCGSHGTLSPHLDGQMVDRSCHVLPTRVFLDIEPQSSQYQ